MFNPELINCVLNIIMVVLIIRLNQQLINQKRYTENLMKNLYHFVMAERKNHDEVIELINEVKEMCDET